MGVTVDEDNNLTVTVAQADGTSRSGSVTLPGGEEIATEYYGEIIESANDVGIITLSKALSVNLSSSASVSWYIHSASTQASEDALYYDGDNSILKRCVTQSLSYGYSGTMRTSRYGDFSTSTYSWLLNAVMDFVNSKEFHTTSNKAFRIRIGTTVVISCNSVTTSNGKVTSIGQFQIYGTFLSTSLTAGTHEARWVWDGDADDAHWYHYATTTSGTPSPPSTYSKIADL